MKDGIRYADDVKEEAKRRKAMQTYEAKDGVVGDAIERGIVAEQTLCAWLGLDWNAERPTEPDSGFQFVIGGHKVKVAGSFERKMNVKTGTNRSKRDADIYVFIRLVPNPDKWRGFVSGVVAAWCERDVILTAGPTCPPRRRCHYQVPLDFLNRNLPNLRGRLGIENATEANQSALFDLAVAPEQVDPGWKRKYG